MPEYRINPEAHGVTIEVTGVAGKQEGLLEAFGECQSGNCTCPTAEYQKLDGMVVEPSEDQVILRLRAKPGTEFDQTEIAACLDHTVKRAGESH